MDPPQADHLPSLRPLGRAEQYSTARSHLGIYANVCVTATYSNRHGKGLPDALYRSITSVMAKHPILSAVPVDTTNTPRFVRLPRLDLNQTVTFIEKPSYTPGATSDATLDELAQSQHNLPFKQDNSLLPFWRITVLENPKDSSWFSLCLCFHHSLLDTQSAVIVHQDLEHALASNDDGTAMKIVQGSQQTLLPPLETMIDLPTSPDFVHAQQSLGEPPKDWWSGKPQTLPVQTRFSSVWIPSASFTSLRRKCKEQGVTLTAALMSLIASAFFRVLPPEYSVVQGDCAVSLRRFLPDHIDQRSAGCYVGSLSEVYSRESQSIWKDAKRTKKTIDETLQLRGADMPVGYLKHVPDIAGWLSGKIGKRRWAAWELSNVGGFDDAPGLKVEDRQIQSVMFSQSASACSGAVKFSAASGRDGRLGLGFTWQEGVVGDEVVKELIQSLVDLIQEITP
ncbi:Alcohol acetyltransferase [Fusarium solani]